jgi:hypothetical protein
MTTTTLQLKRERGRFAEHVKATLAQLVPSTWRLASRPTRKAAATSAADAVSREAQEVREMAHSYSKTDPGFAADLYAAASRHERVHGG